MSSPLSGFKCQLPGCSDRAAFKQKGAMKKHMDKHNRPYKCTAIGCGKDFTNAGDLKRHEQQKHDDHRIVCPITSCKRHRGKGFGRKDNLREHIKRIHGLASSVTEDQTETETSETPDPDFKVDLVMSGEDLTTVLDEAERENTTSTEKSLLAEKLLELKTLRTKWTAAIAKLDGDIAAIERTVPLL